MQKEELKSTVHGDGVGGDREAHGPGGVDYCPPGEVEGAGGVTEVSDD